MSTLPPSRTADQYVLRFPEGMRDRIADAAKANGRSMNAELLSRLQASFQDPVAALLPHLDEDIRNSIEGFVQENGGTLLGELQKRLAVERYGTSMKMLESFPDTQRIRKAQADELVTLRKLAQSQGLNLALLANYLIDMVNRMPGPARETPEARRAVAFALSLDVDPLVNMQVPAGAAVQLPLAEEMEEVQAIVRGKVQGTGVMVPKDSVPASPAVKRAQAKVAKKGVRK